MILLVPYVLPCCKPAKKVHIFQAGLIGFMYMCFCNGIYAEGKMWSILCDSLSCH